MQALLRRIQLIEDDLEKSDERLRTTTQKLAEAHQAADESDRVRKTLENKTNQEIYVARSTWEREHDGKAPSIKYFEALAGQKVSEERTKYAKVDSDLKRFKTAYESIEAKMNSEKKKLDATKFEIGGA